MSDWVPPGRTNDWEPDHIWIKGLWNPKIIRDDRYQYPIKVMMSEWSRQNFGGT